MQFTESEKDQFRSKWRKALFHNGVKLGRFLYLLQNKVSKNNMIGFIFLAAQLQKMLVYRVFIWFFYLIFLEFFCRFFCACPSLFR